MNNPQQLYEHYKAVRARMGIVPKIVTVTLPKPKPAPQKAKKPSNRDVIYLNAPTVIQFPPNKTPDELFNAYDFDKIRLPHIREIVELVCSEYGVERGKIIGQIRTANLTEPRHVIYYLSRHCSLKSTTEIGRALGGRDHSTIIHGINKIENLILKNDAFYLRVNELRRRLSVDSLVHRYWGA